nr:putative receptor-like protein kinase [Ipomoea batatas]
MVAQRQSGIGQAEREFKVEVEAIGHVRHKHLVRLLGYCIEGTQSTPSGKSVRRFFSVRRSVHSGYANCANPVVSVLHVTIEATGLGIYVFFTLLREVHVWCNLRYFTVLLAHRGHLCSIDLTALVQPKVFHCATGS